MSRIASLSNPLRRKVRSKTELSSEMEYKARRRQIIIELRNSHNGRLGVAGLARAREIFNLPASADESDVIDALITEDEDLTQAELAALSSLKDCYLIAVYESTIPLSQELDALDDCDRFSEKLAPNMEPA